jgi:signal transduction histidine kinase
MSLSFDQEPFDIKELLCAVTRNCQPALKAESISLKVNDQEVEEYRNSTGVVMYSGDIGKLRSLLENLIGNAGKYARSRIDIHLHCDIEHIELVVDDDGRGVAEPFRRKIFEEYYQVPGSKNGTGIGLYSVKRIVDHYQGKIAVQSSPLGGARFVVTLPLNGFHPQTALST